MGGKKKAKQPHVLTPDQKKVIRVMMKMEKDLTKMRAKWYGVAEKASPDIAQYVLLNAVGNTFRSAEIAMHNRIEMMKRQGWVGQ